MTVALLSVWGGQPPGTLYTTDAATETAMIAAKVATATLTGAVAWVPPGNSPGTGPTATYKTDPLTGEVELSAGSASTLKLPAGTTDLTQPVGFPVKSQGAIGQVNFDLINDFTSDTGFALARQASGTGDSVVVDSGIYKTSGASLKYTSPTNGTYWGELKLPVFSAAANSQGRVGLWVYIPDYTKVGNLTLYLAKEVAYTNFAAFTYKVMDTGGNRNRFNGWHFVGWKAGNAVDSWAVTGSVTWGDTFTDSKIRVNLPAAVNSAVVYFDSLYFNCQGRAKILITADDQWDSWANLGIPVLTGHKLKSTMAVIGELVGAAGYATQAQINAAYSSGLVDVVVHGRYNLTTLADDVARSADIAANKAYLLANGYTRNSGQLDYVYPNGAARVTEGDDGIINILKAQGFRSSRGVQAGHPVSTIFGIADRAYYYNILGGQNIDTPAALITLIDYCITYGVTGVLMFHKLVAGVAAIDIEYNIDDFKTVMKHIAMRKAQGLLDDMTIPEWASGAI